jgi:hypothetical protein
MPAPRRSLADRLPFSDELSPDERQRWVKQWRHLVWSRPLFLLVRVVALIACAAFWYFVIAQVSFRSTFQRDLARVGGVFFSIGLSSHLTYDSSRRIMERRIAGELGHKET